ncbi:MAG: nuclear transport factor 2 family protein [Pseudomonadales bacterium]|nr:nuclear transport factor 2 family protein [Pseudomonadales bacterium]
MPTLEEKVQRLIDIEDIKILKHRYAKYCDDNYNPLKISELFVKDGIWDGGSLGYAAGRESIKKMFMDTPNLVAYALHSVSNPIIEIDGDEATGYWYLWQPMVIKPNDQALWLIADYEDTFIRVNGEWKFKKLICTPQALSPYEEGFGKVRFIELSKI